MKNTNKAPPRDEVANRVLDLEKKVDHILFMMAECRRIRTCDRCGKDIDE